VWIQTRGAKIRVKLDKNLENSSISNRKKQFIGFFERIFSSDETVDKVSALLYVGCVLLGRVLQAAGRLSLDVRCVRLVSSSCSCLPRPGWLCCGCRACEAPRRGPPGGGVFEERVGVGGRNARDRCTGTGGWVGISESVCAQKMVRNPNCHFKFENLVGGKKIAS